MVHYEEAANYNYCKQAKSDENNTIGNRQNTLLAHTFFCQLYATTFADFIAFFVNRIKVIIFYRFYFVCQLIEDMRVCGAFVHLLRKILECEINNKIRMFFSSNIFSFKWSTSKETFLLFYFYSGMSFILAIELALQKINSNRK